MKTMIIPYACVGIASVCIYIAVSSFYKKKYTNRHVTDIQNTLLTYALMTAAKKDVDSSYDYAKFNGTKMPMMAGCDLHNACSTYIIDRNRFRQDPWYSDIMDQKLVAIEKYLDNKFKSRADTDKFFMEFINVIQKH